jgi:hypothetical protein
VNKLRWGKFFWADWSNDTALRLCSIPARGLWMEMLCLMAQGDPYGVLTVKGRAPSMAELRQLCGWHPAPDKPDPHRHQTREFQRWFDELERNGVFQWVEIVPVDAPDCATTAPDPRQTRAISAPRMRHDGRLAMTRASAAQQRWKVAGDRQSADDLHMQKPGRGAGLHMQNASFASTEAEAESEEDSPPSPRKRGERARARMNGGGRKPSRNGFIDIALDMMEEGHGEQDDARPGGPRVVDLTRHIGSRKPSS